MGKALVKTATTPKTREHWAKAINHSWAVALKAATVAVKSGIETGQFLLSARADLDDKAFKAMIDEDLPFNKAKAYSLMKIAGSPQLAVSHGKLPEAWTVLNKLADLSPDDFKWAIDHGLISPEMTRGAAMAIKRARNGNETVVSISKGERGPTPAEARKIARETGKLVVASDGNMYSGTTEEEDEKYAARRNIGYGIKEAIIEIASCKLTPKQWIDQCEAHWIFDFEPDTVAEAIDFLNGLRPLLAKRKIKAVQ